MKQLRQLSCVAIGNFSCRSWSTGLERWYVGQNALRHQSSSIEPMMIDDDDDVFGFFNRERVSNYYDVKMYLRIVFTTRYVNTMVRTCELRNPQTVQLHSRKY